MATIRFFAAARDAAGVSSDEVDGDTVDDVLANASARYGADFAAVLPTCAIWVNGDPATGGQPVSVDDEVAVLPPVSGGN